MNESTDAQKTLMGEYNQDLKDLALIASIGMPDAILSASNLIGNDEAFRTEVWNNVTETYKPYFGDVTPISYEYYEGMRKEENVPEGFKFNPAMLLVPLAISLTASSFANDLKKFNKSVNKDLLALQADVAKTFISGFQNQGAETLANFTLQDNYGDGVILVPRIGACNWCSRSAADGPTKKPRFHKNCGCRKRPVFRDKPKPNNTM